MLVVNGTIAGQRMHLAPFLLDTADADRTLRCLAKGQRKVRLGIFEVQEAEYQFYLDLRKALPGLGSNACNWRGKGATDSYR